MASKFIVLVDILNVTGATDEEKIANAKEMGIEFITEYITENDIQDIGVRLKGESEETSLEFHVLLTDEQAEVLENQKEYTVLNPN